MVLDSSKSTDRGESNTIKRQSCLLSILVACVTTRLSTCSLAQRYWPGLESGPGREIRSSEFRHISINQSINQSVSLIATLRPESWIANDMQLK